MNHYQFIMRLHKALDGKIAPFTFPTQRLNKTLNDQLHFGP